MADKHSTQALMQKASRRTRAWLRGVALAVGLCASAAGASPAQAQGEVVFNDDFPLSRDASGAPLPNQTVDPSKWQVHDGNWFIQETAFGAAPQLLTEGETTFARLPLHTHNPQFPGQRFLGTEAWTRQEWTAGSGTEFEARIRATRTPRGMILGFFTYKRRDFGNDADQEEVDFEFITNRINDPARSTSFWSNAWNGPTEDGEMISVPGLNQTAWNTYTIRWTNTQLQWFVNGVPVRTETQTVPDEQMAVALNIWAGGWENDVNWTTTPNAANNRTSYFDVDYVRVRRLAPAPGSGAVGTGAGLSGTYFGSATTSANGVNLANEQFSRIAPRINFTNWGANSPDPRLSANGWGARFEGNIQAQHSETYTLHVSALNNDGVRLWVDGNLLLSRAPTTSSAQTIKNSVSVPLQAGRMVPIRIEYWDPSGDARLSLAWSSPSTPEQLVPGTQLYPVMLSTPSLSPEAGRYFSAQSVRVTSPEPGVDLHYTLDGREPERTDAEVASGGTISLGSSARLKVRAWKDGFWASGIKDAAYTIILDSTAPQVAFSSPTDTWSYQALAQAQGTANDSGGSGLAAVSVRLNRDSDGAFWSPSSSTWSATPVDTPVAASNGAWSYALPALIDGRYTLRASASDEAGNTGTSSVVSFYIDTLAPTATLAQPGPGFAFRSLAQASGTASDVGTGVSSVSGVLQRVSDNAYWNGWAWAPTEARLPATLSGSSWSLPLPALEDGQYLLRAIARDWAGNEASSAQTPFAIDATAPQVLVAQPANGARLSALAALSGTASDGEPGVAGASVRLQRTRDWAIWNGTGWVGAEAEVAAQSGQGAQVSWSLPLPTLEDGGYTARVSARDFVGNVRSTEVAWAIDRAGPTLTISSPAQGSTWGAWSALSGRASDDSGIHSVEVALRSGEQFWNGGAWSPAYAGLAAQFNGFSWLLSTGLPPVSSGAYEIIVTATDSLGNTATARSSVAIVAPTPTPRPTATPTPTPPDRTPPSAAISSPTGGSALRALPVLRGTATDNRAVARVEVAVYRHANRLYWTGRAWSTRYASVRAVVAGRLWSLAQVPAGLNLPEGLYTVSATAYDAVALRGTSSATVRIDRSGPTLAWTSPNVGVQTSYSSLVPPFPLSLRAGDAAGVRNVDLHLLRRADSRYWNGGQWQAGLVPLPMSLSTGLWRRATGLPTRAQMAPGSYDLMVFAYDRLGNRSIARLSLTLRASPSPIAPRSTSPTAPSTVLTPSSTSL
jgi:hypothetical protein